MRGWALAIAGLLVSGATWAQPGPGPGAPGPTSSPSPAPVADGGGVPSPSPSPSPDPVAAPAISAASLSQLVDRLSAAADAEVAPLVAEIEAAGAAGAEPAALAALPDALFLAARACEERLLDPARALALYERILARHADARVAVAAGRRARHLREQVGKTGGSTAEAQDFARLVAASDRLPLAQALRRADELAARTWGGAAEVLLWSAELVRRRGATTSSDPTIDARGDLVEAMRRYRLVMARFPGSAEAKLALRGLAGAAADARDWALTEELARQLPIASAADEVTREELLARAATGRATERWLTRAAVVLGACTLFFVASLLQLLGWRPRRQHLRTLRPPLEVAYLAPVAVVLIGAALTAHTSIAPAVSLICAGGLALSWLSGATLVEARRLQRSSRLRTALHLAAGALAALALAYLAVTGTGLLDLLIATVRLGPEL